MTEGQGGTRWVDPRYAAMVETFDDEVQRTIRRRGGTQCNECGGLGVRLFVMPETNAPVRVPCSACNPGGA
ncbi:hypothetical protein [Streptomyces tsukubensis]|uniref:hypothetical protein n=1 Tax=Streptomyces tsukubensis TaxID=83656 RepID=UPI00344F3A9D